MNYSIIFTEISFSPETSSCLQLNADHSDSRCWACNCSIAAKHNTYFISSGSEITDELIRNAIPPILVPRRKKREVNVKHNPIYSDPIVVDKKFIPPVSTKDCYINPTLHTAVEPLISETQSSKVAVTDIL